MRDQHIGAQGLQVSRLVPELCPRFQLEGAIPREDGLLLAHLRWKGDAGAPDPQCEPGVEVERSRLQLGVEVLDPEVLAQLLSLRPQLLQYEVMVPPHQHPVLVSLTTQPPEPREHLGARGLQPPEESLEVLRVEAPSALLQEELPLPGPGLLVAEVSAVHQQISGRQVQTLVQQVGVADGHQAHGARSRQCPGAGQHRRLRRRERHVDVGAPVSQFLGQLPVIGLEACAPHSGAGIEGHGDVGPVVPKAGPFLAGGPFWFLSTATLRSPQV